MRDLSGGASDAKTYRHGTHRATAPADTIARIRPLMAAFGITRVANLTGLDRTGVPVVMVCRPNARSTAVFHGKGLDLAAAKASGLMEAVETWHAEHVHRPLRLGSVADLDEILPLVEASDLPRVPGSRFRRDLPMLWIEGRDLIGGGPMWVPFDAVHADGTLVELPGRGCFAASTNGLASGNHPLEAVSHALCEVIERDATSLWHRLHPALRDRTRLDLATVDDTDCRAVLDRLDRAGLDVAVWEITTDVGVPAFQCQAIDRIGEMGHVGHGAGCHPTIAIALLRAVTEAAQVRTTYIVGAREDIEHGDYSPETLAARHYRARELARPVTAMRDFADCGRFAFDTFGDEVAWLGERLKAAGVRQAVAVDLGRPEYGVSVVRVVVPGLEGSDHHSAYTPGARARVVETRRP